MQTLSSVPHVKCRFTSGVVVFVVICRLYGFSCKRYNGTIQEADLVENLKVNREAYGCSKSFFYIWETLLMEMVDRIVLLQLE